MKAAATARYRRESDPVRQDGPDVLALDSLVAGLVDSGAAISTTLRSLDEATLGGGSGDDGKTPLGDRVHFQYFHDTYHTGHTELLRQVTGIADKII